MKSTTHHPSTSVDSFSDFLVSFFYALGRFAIGLLIHPYQTMQLLVEEGVFVWLAFLPAMILGFATAAWRALLLPILRISSRFICQGWQQTCLGLGTAWMSFAATWIVVFCIYWQILLLYLLFRFYTAFKASED